MKLEIEIKDALKEDKVLIGKDKVIKSLKLGSLGSVFCASNCPQALFSELDYYAKFSRVQLERLSKDSAKLGQVCGKPFNITVLGIKK